MANYRTFRSWPQRNHAVAFALKLPRSLSVTGSSLEITFSAQNHMSGSSPSSSNLSNISGMTSSPIAIVLWYDGHMAMVTMAGAGDVFGIRAVMRGALLGPGLFGLEKAGLSHIPCRQFVQ